MKTRTLAPRPADLERLVVFGGKPAFDEILHVGRPNIGDRAYLLEKINDVLDSRWFTNRGPLVQEFEREVERLSGVRHCVATCNGTLALEIAVRAAGLSGEVIVPSFTFVATAHALEWQGITPVFCDVDPRTHNLDPERVDALITPQTTGIIGVHTWGRPCDVDALSAIADRNGLGLLFDAAHAFGCSAGGKRVGGFGKAEIFSFHATKFIHCLEGGAVVTNDDEMARTMRLMQNFGFAGLDRVVHVGTNAKMDEFSAAMGLSTLKSMETIVAHNHDVYRAYEEGMAGIPGLRLIDYDVSEEGNYQFVIVEVDEGATGLSRDALLILLRSENVLARRYFYPGCHRMEPYRTKQPDVRLAETEALSERVLALPTGETIGGRHVETICHVLRTAVENAPEVRERIAAYAREARVDVPKRV